MMYNEGTNLVVCVSVAIGPVGPTSNFGRLFIILIENTSIMAEFEYRPIKMPPTPYFTLVTTRGQRSIPRLTISPTRGQYHSNGTILRSGWNPGCQGILTFIYQPCHGAIPVWKRCETSQVILGPLWNYSIAKVHYRGHIYIYSSLDMQCCHLWKDSFDFITVPESTKKMAQCFH